jgi:hypothetical protein
VLRKNRFEELPRTLFHLRLQLPLAVAICAWKYRAARLSTGAVEAREVDMVKSVLKEFGQTLHFEAGHA